MIHDEPGTKARTAFVLPAIFLLLFTTTVRADWINLTGAETSPNIAEITVLDDRAQVALEVYVRDLATFSALVPDDWLKDQAAERPPRQSACGRFLRMACASSPTAAGPFKPGCAWSSRACARTASRRLPA